MELLSFVCISIAFLTILGPLRGTNASPNDTDQQIVSTIDQFVNDVMKCHLSPALSLAVVRDGHVLLSNGYSTNINQPITSHSKFSIGSLTKAFTATLVAKWVLEQDTKITLDTPIKSFYKEFEVGDNERSSHATLRDLLSHRMGLQAYFTPLIVGIPPEVTRAQLVRRLATFPVDDVGFRSEFIYNNWMYMLAGHIMEQMSGNNQTWEEIIRETFLLPLNMSSTGFIDKPDSYSDITPPCVFVNESIEYLSPELLLAVTQCGPAGSVYSTADDMAKWIKFQLSKGLGPQDNRVVAEEVLQLTHQPGMLPSKFIKDLYLPTSQVSKVEKSYNLGWREANYRGYRKMYHAGHIVTHESRLVLFPDVNSGIFVAVNGPNVPEYTKNLLESIMYFISDLLLNLDPWLTQEDVCQKMEDLMGRYSTTVPETLATHPPTGNNFSHYVGNYTNKCFGTLQLYMDDATKAPLLRYGRFGRFSLEPVSAWHFKCQFLEPLTYLNDHNQKLSLKVSPNADGEIDAVFFQLDIVADLVRFDCLNNLSNEVPEIIG